MRFKTLKSHIKFEAGASTKVVWIEMSITNIYLDQGFQMGANCPKGGDFSKPGGENL